MANELRQANAAVPAADRWMYSFNGTPGTRTIASTFSALPQSAGVDDRFGQFLLKFDTLAAGIPAGLGPENYDPQRVVLTVVLAAGENIAYDPTADPRASHGASAVADPDPGRPLELHGTGFRHGFSAASFMENSPFGGSAPGARNAHALGFSPDGLARDVSHNVTLGFDAPPWAIGKIRVLPAGETAWVELPAGAPIPAYARAVFEIDLSLPGVIDYVRKSFHQGFLWLSLSSFHSATQQGVAGYPAFFTKEHPEQQLFGDVASSLSVDYTLPLRIHSFIHAGAVSRIEWNASPGFGYQVQQSPDMGAGSWLGLTPEPVATPLPARLFMEVPTAGARGFFRIVRTSQP